MKELSHHELHEKTLKAAENEKQATLTLLEYLAEVDRRRLYAIRGYESLWAYVNKALGYSEWQSSERVNAMRLMMKVPEIKTELESGRMTLTTVAKLGMHSRKEKLKPEETASLLKEVVGKSSREVEKVLVSNSCERHPERAHLFEAKETIKPVTQKLTRITIDVEDEFLSLLGRMKELNGNPAATAHELFTAAMKEYVKRREPKSIREDTKLGGGAKLTLGAQSAARQNTTAKQTRYLRKTDREETRKRSGERCEYVDRETGRRCECRTGLEFDHIRPFALDGSNDASNLRHYCPAHNRLAAMQIYGEEKMRMFLRQ